MKKRHYDSNILSIYFDEIGDGYLSNDEILELFKRYHEGDMEARNKIIHNYLKLVISIANELNNENVDYLDLIEEGNIGLIKAVDSFDSSINSVFITYAYEKIKYYMFDYLNRNNSLFKLPALRAYDLATLRRAIYKFNKEYGYIPSIEELHKITLINTEELRRLQNVINRDSFSQMMLEMTDEEDIIEDEYSFEDEFLDKEYDTFIVSSLLEDSGLSGMETQVIRSVYGFDGKIMNCSEIARQRNVSPQAISQYMHNGISKMKKYAYRKRLY